jgi:hypothetical protein
MAVARTVPSTSDGSRREPRAFSLVLGLLMFSVFVNYIDRGNLSIAAPMLKDELGLSGTQLGLLLSSSFWTYSLFLIVSGWLVDRLQVGWVMAAGFLLSASKWVKRRYTRLLRSSRSRSRKLQPFRCFMTQQRSRRSGAKPWAKPS